MSALHRQLAADFAAEPRPACLRLAVALCQPLGGPAGPPPGGAPAQANDEFTSAACALSVVLHQWGLISPDDPAVGLSPDERAVVAVFARRKAVRRALAVARAAAARIVSAKKPPAEEGE